MIIPEGQPFKLHGWQYSGRRLRKATPEWLAKHGIEVIEPEPPRELTERERAAVVELSREAFLGLVDDLAGLGPKDPSALEWLREAVARSYLTPLRRRRALNAIEAANIIRRQPKVDQTLWDDLFFQTLKVERDEIDRKFLEHAEAEI